MKKIFLLALYLSTLALSGCWWRHRGYGGGRVIIEERGGGYRGGGDFHGERR